MLKSRKIRISVFAALVTLIVGFESLASTIPVPQVGAAVVPGHSDPPALNRISLETVGQVECLQALKGHRGHVLALAVSSDGAYLASSGRDETIRLWDVRTRKEVHSFDCSVAKINGIAFSPDGKLLASGEAIWNLETKKKIQALNEGMDARVDFSPDGSLIEVALRDNQDISQPTKLWDVASGKVIRTFDNQNGNGTHSIAFSADGKLLAVANPFGTVALWDVKSGKIASTLDCGVKKAAMHDVLFSPKGDVLASAGTDCYVRLWEVASGKEIKKLSHRGGVNALAFSQDGTMLASAGEGRAVRLWNVESGKLLRTLPHGDELMAVALSPDGTLLVSGGYDGRINLWGLPH